MKKKIVITIGITSIFLLTCCSIWVVYVLCYSDSGPDYPIDILNFTVVGSSQIDPQTLLQSVEQGDTSVFQVDTGLPEDPQYIMPVEWTQAEFMMVAEALFQLVWNESLESWNLYRMNFFSECKDDSKGFGQLDLFFYRETVNIWKYSVRIIQIYPDYGYVSWGSNTNWPRRSPFNWKTIDLYLMEVPADEAVKFAEAKGGKDFRMDMKNACQIAVNLNPELYNRYAWSVSYWGYYNLEFWIPFK